MLRWEECKSDFAWDGSLCDVYITPATLSDWELVYSMLRAWPRALFTVDGDTKPAPATVREVLSLRDTASLMLQVTVGRVTVNTHFFCEDEIEFDIDPRELASQTDFDALLSFMRQLGDTVRRHVLLTPEGGREYPIISYWPADQRFQHHPIVQ
jgi:hypothetical protein